MLDVNAVRDLFQQHYGIHPRLIVRAPGRVNLIGEHTDYNGGYVFPVALDRATYVAARPRDDAQMQVIAADIGATDHFALNNVVRSTKQPWSNYVRGVVRGLQVAGHAIGGANLLITSDVPQGAGLSSSAALEVGTGYTLQLLNRLDILGEELALVAQGAEHTYVGVQCGIMDQFIAALGQADHALLIDCRNLTYRPVPLPTGVKIVIADSGVRHSLADSGYNERRAQCEQAVQLLKPVLPKITQLRDVSTAELAKHGHLLPDVVLRRARHVVTENQRVLDSVAALEDRRYDDFGALMNASHQSMRNDYEITTPELDALAAAGQAVNGCYGSRMTGGGFGGCTVSLVEDSAVEHFTSSVATTYQDATGRTPIFYICKASNGVGRAVGS